MIRTLYAELLTLAGLRKEQPVKKLFEVEIAWARATPAQREAEIRRLDEIYQKTGRCPDCQQGEGLLHNSEGGTSVNVKCGYCHNWFNALYDGASAHGIQLIDRIRLKDAKYSPTLKVIAENPLTD